MVVNIPPSIEHFCTEFCQELRKTQGRLLQMLLTGLLLVPGKRTQAALGRAVKRHKRNRSSISRLLKRVSFRTRDLHKRVCQKLIDWAAEALGRERRIWVLLIDGTCTRRGGFTKIANAEVYHRKTKERKRNSTKAHTFVMGLLVTDNGMRIPVPRRTYGTKAYCRETRRKYCSQQRLAELMIRELKLPAGVRLVVMADEYFEGRLLWNVCRQLGHTWIAPVDNRRCFGDEHKCLPGKSLHARGKALPRGAYTTMALIRGRENTAPYRRHWTRRVSSRNRRCYRISHEIRGVAKLGDALVVYSWKTPVYRPRRDFSREGFKVLICSNLSMTAQEVVEWYEIRWQIELYFRELKSHLGLADFMGQDFEAFERHVDLVMLAFASQELRRARLLAQKPPPKLEGQLRAARTQTMCQLLEEEAETTDVEYFRQCMTTEKGRSELLYLLPALRQAS